MRIVDMHCDTLIEGWRHPELSFADGDLSINLKLLKEHGRKAQFCYGLPARKWKQWIPMIF